MKHIMTSRALQDTNNHQRRYERHRASHSSSTSKSRLFSIGNLLKARLFNPGRLACTHSLQFILRTSITSQSHWSRSQHYRPRLCTKDRSRARTEVWRSCRYSCQQRRPSHPSQDWRDRATDGLRDDGCKHTDAHYDCQ